MAGLGFPNKPDDLSQDDGDFMSSRFIEETAAMPTLSSPNLPKQQVHMRQTLQQGLDSALPEHNLGHRLLSRLGYKHGMGLGKHGRGRAEPVPIHIHTGAGARPGIGQAKHIREQEERRLRRHKRATQLQQSNFREQMSDKFAMRTLEFRLRSCRRACRQLDESHNVMTNYMWIQTTVDTKLYHPEYHSSGYEREFDPDMDALHQGISAQAGQRKQKLEEQIDEMLAYMRTEYNYCFYCGSSYDSAEDLVANCPGLFEEDHD